MSNVFSCKIDPNSNPNSAHYITPVFAQNDVNRENPDIDSGFLFATMLLTSADVAELADALRSGRSERTLVRVQIPPSALDKNPQFFWGFFYSNRLIRRKRQGKIKVCRDVKKTALNCQNSIFTI